MSGQERFVVIGAGVMGRGIAHVAAMSGYATTLCDLSQAQLDGAKAGIEAALDKGIAKGKVTGDAKAETLGNLTLATDWMPAAAEAHVVVEAVPEDLTLKRDLFRELDLVTPRDTLLGTNTSSLSITEVASACGHAERVVGMHFFNPVHIVKLLEIVDAVQTSAATLERAREVGARMGREMIVVNDSPGFATSRLGLVLGLEAIRMLEGGVASAEDIDRAMTLGYRHPMGPLRLTDLVGLDTRLKIAEYLHAQLGGEQFRPPVLLRQMVRAGKLGKKSGQGFYTW